MTMVRGLRFPVDVPRGGFDVPAGRRNFAKLQDLIMHVFSIVRCKLDESRLVRNSRTLVDDLIKTSAQQPVIVAEVILAIRNRVARGQDGELLPKRLWRPSSRTVQQKVEMDIQLIEIGIESALPTVIGEQRLTASRLSIVVVPGNKSTAGERRSVVVAKVVVTIVRTDPEILRKQSRRNDNPRRE